MSDFRLRVFRSVARNLSFTRASQELFISQPAVTKHIQELETAYKVRLFERMGSRIALTEAGRLLLTHCDRLLDDYDRLAYDMSLLHRQHEGRVAIGASTTIAQYVLPPLVARFLEKFPRVSLSLMSGNSQEVEEALTEHRVQVGLVEGLTHRTALRYAHFLDDELVAVVSASHPLSTTDEITIEQLQSIPLVLRENGSGTLEVIRRALAEHNLKLSDMLIKLHLGSTESIKLYLENSDCMGIVSVRSVRRELYEGRLKAVDIRGMKMTREFHVVSLQGAGEAEGVASLFVQFILHYKEKL